jgi:glutamate-ammonia-ligase adenylyltransferase
MYTSLRQDSARNDRESDIKRGPGGIREIEFLVQTFQLLRGGRERALQTTSLRTALSAIGELSLLPAQVTEAVWQDYRFLRRLENAIQALHDQQTHSLPAGKDLERVSLAMGFKRTEELLLNLQASRKRVLALIEKSFPEHRPQAESGSGRAQWLALKNEEPLSGPFDHLLLDFMASLSRLKLSQRAGQRLDRFMPGLLQQIQQPGITAPVLRDVLNLVLAICQRSAYLSLLVQNPPALKRMLMLFTESDWIASRVIRHPALLDELIDPSLGKLLPDRDEMDRNAERVLDSNPDTESALQALNHMKRAFSLRIAVAELETTLSVRQVQQCLTWLAETIIQHCYLLARRDVRMKHGSLAGDGIAVIGYGTLGATELGYLSDLDLIFLYRHGNTLSDGQRPLEPERYNTAIVRRMLSFLTSSTTSGRLYEVDTRLRPNGRSGLLVSSLKAFEKYQKNDAWTWELQALSRARPCAGSASIGSEFIRIRKEILGQPRDRETLLDEVKKMRVRLRDAHTSGDPFKHGPGGLVDIDFVTQAGVLELAVIAPEVLDAVGTLDQLRALGAAAWIPADQLEPLLLAYESLTRSRHQSLLLRDTGDNAGPLEECADICRSILQFAPGG